MRFFKTVAIVGGLSLTFWEYSNLRKKMTFYDRFYPEPTELQRKLMTEAAIFRQAGYQEESTSERMAKVEDPEKALRYSQFYMLAPQSYTLPEEEINAPDQEQH